MHFKVDFVTQQIFLSVQPVITFVQFYATSKHTKPFLGGAPDSQSRASGFESPLLPFQSLDIFVLSTTPLLTQLYKVYLAIDSGGYVTE